MTLCLRHSEDYCESALKKVIVSVNMSSVEHGFIEPHKRNRILSTVSPQTQIFYFRT
jgi:hypothetical protein